MRRMASQDAWFFSDGIGGSSYCLTWVRGIDPGELLARAGVREVKSYQGAAALIEPSYAAWGEPRQTEMLIAAIPLGDGSLAVEVNGFLGVTESVAAVLSAGTELVSHQYSDGNGVGRFLWLRDGDLLLEFEPLFPRRRRGQDPDAWLDVMPELGFDLRDEPDLATFDHRAAAFALAQHIAGVRLTRDAFQHSLYLGGMAPAPVP